jgi:hypothetical protein
MIIVGIVYLNQLNNRDMKLKNEIRKDKNGNDIHIVFKMGGFDKDILCAYAHRLVYNNFMGYKYTKLVNIYNENDVSKLYCTSGSYIVFTKQVLEKLIDETVWTVDRVLRSQEAKANALASLNEFRN